MASKQRSAGSWQEAGSRCQGSGIRCQVSGIRDQESKSQNPKIPKSQNPSHRRAFTLVDLLVTITIIAILSGLVAGVVGLANQQARIDQTQRLVDKLNRIIMTKYDSYRTRRVPMDLRAYVAAHDGDTTTNYGYEEKTSENWYDPATEGWSREIARAQVNAIRDLMRLEMPDRWSDVIRTANPADPSLVPLVLQSAPSLSQRYNRIYNKASATDKWGAAECLYMIVMAIPGAAEQFREDEIGDVDGDGLPEFIDAWGNPIRFLRWPAGFYHDPDDNFFGNSNLQFGPKLLLPSNVDNLKHQPDPFDPQLVLSDEEDGFAIFPLIYSAGPDGEFDINIGKAVGGSATYPYGLDANGNVQPFEPDGAGYWVGQPHRGDTDDPSKFFTDLRHTDNIHNHRRAK